MSMDDQPFTNREIRSFHEELRNDIKEIKTQVKTTNGRVSSLEQWKWFISGGLAILTMLVVPVILMLVGRIL